MTTTSTLVDQAYSAAVDAITDDMHLQLCGCTSWPERCTASVHYSRHWLEPVGVESTVRALHDLGYLTTPGRIECTAEPRHPAVAVQDADGYPLPCPWCLHDRAWERVRELEGAENARRHRRHRLYANTRFAHWLAGWAYRLGVIAGHGRTWDAACNGCETGMHFRGRRPYILGWPAWKWSCVLRGRHWPGEYLGLDRCAKCLPCPSCGSTTAGHRAGCVDA